MAGINAGRIIDIQLSGNQALVTFEVLKSVKVTVNSVLRIKTIGMLGDKYLDIYLGEEGQGERLAENTLIPSQSGGGLEDLTKDASEIITDLKAVIKSFRESIAPDGKETPLVQILEDIKEVTDNAKMISRSFRRVVGDNEEKVTDLLGNLNKLSESLVFHTDPDQKGGFLSDFKKVGAVMDDAKVAMSDLKAIIGDVKSGKGTIGKLLRDDEVVDNVNQTLSGVGRVFNRFNSIQTDLSLFSNYNTSTNSRNEVSLNVNTSPASFFKLGLVTSELGPKTEKQIVSTVNGRTTTEEREEHNKSSYRFNFQLGRAVHNWNLRAGLIESTGGLGLDYNISYINTRLTLEAFDFKKTKGPNLRLLTEVHVWNVIYGRIGFEELLPERQKESFTLGAGLRFSDDDIKGLLALFLR